MTEQTTTQADPALNGKAQGVPPAEQVQADEARYDHVLGLMICLAGVALIFAGVDRYLGGALSTALASVFGGDRGEESG